MKNFIQNFEKDALIEPSIYAKHTKIFLRKNIYTFFEQKHKANYGIHLCVDN